MVSLLLIISLCFMAGNTVEDDSFRVKRNYNQPPSSPNYDNSYSADPLDLPPQCPSPPACLSPVNLPNADGTLDISKITELGYLSLGSCWGYVNYATVLLGRDVLSLRELQESCITDFIAKDGLSYTSGYGAQVIQNCTTTFDSPSPPFSCTTVGGDPGTDPNSLAPEMDYVIATDGVHWVLLYRCVNGIYGDFELYTFRPYFTRSILRTVLPMIYHLGFPHESIMGLQCYSPTYLVPFQNYPIPDNQLAKGTCPSI